MIEAGAKPGAKAPCCVNCSYLRCLTHLDASNSPKILIIIISLPHDKRSDKLHENSATTDSCPTNLGLSLACRGSPMLLSLFHASGAGGEVVSGFQWVFLIAGWTPATGGSDGFFTISAWQLNFCLVAMAEAWTLSTSDFT